MKFYLEDTNAVLNEVRSTENGLSSAEAEKRLAENGKNKLKEAEKDSLFKKILSALGDPMIIMLLVAALIQAVVAVIEAGGKPKLTDFADVLIILVVVIINTIMSLVQESKAEAAMEALMQMTAATSHVIRDGRIDRPVRGATLIGRGADVLMKIDRVGTRMTMAQGMCGASSGSIPTNVGQPMIRVTDMTVGGR